MQVQTKHRLVGLLILLAVLAIFLPLLFHNSQPTAPKPMPLSIPPEPEMSHTTPDNKDAFTQAPTQSQTTPSNVSIAEAPSHEISAQEKSLLAKEPLMISAHGKAATKAFEKVSAEASQPQPSKNISTTVIAKKPIKDLIKQPKAWVVQLGTFANADNAKKLVAHLRQKGFDAYTRSLTNAAGHQLQRVFVGPEIKKDQAEKLLVQLQNDFHLKGMVHEYEVAPSQDLTKLSV